MLQEFEGYNSLEYQPRGRGWGMNFLQSDALGGKKKHPLYQTGVPANLCRADIRFCRIVK